MSIKYENFDDLPNFEIPRQKLKSSKKTESWWKQCVNGIIKLSSEEKQTGRSSRQAKMENYDLMNSKFRKDAFLAITDRHGLNEKEEDIKEVLPVQMFNIVRSKIERLKGEEMERMFGFQAVGIDGEVLQIRMDQRKALIREALQQMLQSSLGEQPMDEAGNPIPQPELEKIIKDFDKNWQDIREKWVNQILHYLKRRENLELKFNEGWEHALVGGEEIYYAGISKGEPKLRVVNTLNSWLSKTPHMNKVQDAEYFVERRIMSKSEIADDYGEYLSSKDLDKLDSKDYNSLINGMNFPTRLRMFGGGGLTDTTDIESILNQGWDDDPYMNQETFQRGQFAVYCSVWKSWKKIGFLTYPDEAGEIQTEQVDDTFVLDEEQKLAGWTVEWTWIIETWQGYKIPALDIYFGGQAIENQVNGELPYIGRIYNATNSESTSLVELMKPYQYIHAMTWHKIKQEVAKAKGKKLVFDMAQLPKSQGMDMDTIMHYFDNLDILLINSMEEGREGDPNSISKFNQFTSIDMGISSTFTALMALLIKIEEGVDSITGVSKQREGDISASETATNAGRAIAQSTFITEPLFYIHNQCKVEVLNHLVKIAQIAYRNGKSAQFLMNDAIRVILDVDGELLNDSDYTVFISGSPSDRQVLESLKGLAQIALQSDKANLSDIMTIYKATSISEVETVIRAGEEDKLARDQAAQENANNVAIQQQQLVNQNAKDQRDWEAVERQKDRDNKLQIGQISQLGLSDLNNSGVPDILEIENLKFKNSQHQADLQFEEKKLAQSKELEDKKLKLKEKEIEVKKMQAKKKPSSK